MEKQTEAKLTNTLDRVNERFDKEDQAHKSVIERNGAAKLKLAFLKDKGQRRMYDLPSVQKFRKDVKNFSAEIDHNISNRYDRQAIIKKAYSGGKVLKETFKAELRLDIENMEQWQKDFKAAFTKSHTQYNNPQAEILKRQDFDIKLATMTQNDLTDFVNNLDNHPLLSSYELNKLILAAKGNLQLTEKLMAYKNANFYEREYERQPEWQQVQRTLVTAKGWLKGDTMWFLDDDNHLQILNVDSLLNEKLKGYRVSDPSQRYWS